MQKNRTRIRIILVLLQTKLLIKEITSLDFSSIVAGPDASLCALRLLIPLEQDGYQHRDQQESLVEQERHDGDAADACQARRDQQLGAIRDDTLPDAGEDVQDGCGPGR